MEGLSHYSSELSDKPSFDWIFTPSSVMRYCSHHTSQFLHCCGWQPSDMASGSHSYDIYKVTSHTKIIFMSFYIMSECLTDTLHLMYGNWQWNLLLVGYNCIYILIEDIIISYFICMSWSKAHIQYFHSFMTSVLHDSVSSSSAHLYEPFCESYRWSHNDIHQPGLDWKTLLSDSDIPASLPTPSLSQSVFYPCDVSTQ